MSANRRRTRTGSVFGALFGAVTPSPQLPEKVFLKTPDQNGNGSAAGELASSSGQHPHTLSPSSHRRSRSRNSNAMDGSNTPVTPLQLMRLNYTADLPLQSLEEQYARALDFISKHPKAFTELQLSSLLGWLEIAKQSEAAATRAGADPGHGGHPGHPTSLRDGRGNPGRRRGRWDFPGGQVPPPAGADEDRARLGGLADPSAAVPWPGRPGSQEG